jgi:PKD repeat protein
MSLRIPLTVFVAFLLPASGAMYAAVADTSQSCDAQFSSAAAPGNPLEIHFTDLSTGNIYEWSWSFGDGSTSTWQNPIHIYAINKKYQVCLTIQSADTSGYCTDTQCDSIWAGPDTTKYFDLGGHLFAGQYPINNPESTLDTGIATLYRLVNDQPLLVDTNEFTYLGYYTFPHTPEGRYVIKAELKPGSARYNNYLPAWYPDAATWQSSTVVDLSDSNVYNADIHLLPASFGIFDPSGPDAWGLSLYPNPASGYLTVAISGPVHGVTVVEVLNMLGQVEKSAEFRNDPGGSVFTMSLENLNPGIYFLVVRTGNILRQAKKFLLE